MKLINFYMMLLAREYIGHSTTILSGIEVNTTDAIATMRAALEHSEVDVDKLEAGRDFQKELRAKMEAL